MTDTSQLWAPGLCNSCNLRGSLYLLQIEVNCRHQTWMWQLQETQPPDHWLLVRQLWKRAFLATKVFLGVLEKWWLKQNSDLAHFNTCQISSCLVPIRNSFHHSQIIVFLTWTHTKRAIQRCVPMPLAPSGCYRTPGWHWGSVFCLILSLGFHHCSSSLGSPYSKRKFFLYNGQSCLYSMR